MPEDDRPPSHEAADTIPATLPASDAIGLGATALPPPSGIRATKGALPERYHLGARLGAGGMGEVLLATDQQIGREVAIKRMLVASESAEARFLREAKIQGRLEHPAIVPVHELTTDSQGRPFFVMKRLTGTTLADVVTLNAPKFSRQRLLRAFADVCLAIEFAHSRGIIHRDLKPANIMLGDFGEVYVIDWGLARSISELDGPEEAVANPSQPGATEVGAILGTPGYMPPEQLEGLSLDGRADVYALGCILFEILAGEPLLRRGANAFATVHTEDDARPSLRTPDRDIPPELDELCLAATRNDRERRSASARVLAERVEHYLDGDRDTALRRTLAEAHLVTARAALASGDGEGERATAMHEAGRAIALDPASGDAAALVGQLMLEPPRVVPADVKRRLEQIEDETTRRRGKLVAFISFSFLGFIPVFAWLGITDAASVIVFGLAVILNGTVGYLLSRRTASPSIFEVHVFALSNAVVTALLARMFTPFLIAPGIAAVSAMMFLADLRMRAKLIVPLTIFAVLLPWGLELTGLLSQTIHELSGDLVLHSPTVNVRLPQTAIALALFVCTLVGLSALVAKRLGETQRAALATVELQAWHLRQLVRR